MIINKIYWFDSIYPVIDINPSLYKAVSMKTTIDIPEPLYKAAKIRAVEYGQTLREVVVAALERDLRGSEAEEPAAPYFARRTLRPGFEKLVGTGALAPQSGQKSVDTILDEIRADQPT